MTPRKGSPLGAKRASLVLLALACGAVPVPVSDGPRVFRSGPERTRLVELFSSEGCSSCPPADRWLSGLRSRDGLWTRFVPVAYHVSYWDYLGWRDRLASKRYTERQRRYARSWGTDRVYTPGFVVDGVEWVGGPGSGDFPKPDPERPGGGELSVRAWRDRLEVSFSGKSGDRAHAALLGFGIKSEVAAGENAGETLRHDFAVLATAAAPLRGGRASIPLPKPSVPAREYGVAVWIVEDGDLRPLQAAGGILP